MKFVRVDLSAKTVVDQAVPDAYQGIGEAGIDILIHQRPCPCHL